MRGGGAHARRALVRAALAREVGALFVAVVADTHLPRGRRRLAPECIDLLARADLLLHAGDFTARAAYDEVAALAPLLGVHGNADDAELKELLPERRVVEAGGARIGMLHDAGPRTGRADRLAAAFPGCAVVVHGHTHLPEIVRHEGIWIVNPGSPTERRRAPHRSLATLEVDSGEVRPRLVVVGGG